MTSIGIATGELGGDVRPSGDDALFQACSISKHVTALGVLRLVADGAIDLDTDVNVYLTSWRLPGAEVSGDGLVTVRQLLAHTAGLSKNWFPGYAQGEPVPSLLQTLRGEPPANTPPVRRELPPGAEYRYSGSHYAVLQQLLIDVTGTPFDELMARLVLGPVGMADSSFDQRFPHENLDRVARGHDGGEPVPGGWHTVPEMAGAGLWSTPADLVRLELEICRAVTGDSALLPRHLAEQMLTPQLPGGSYGLGTELAGVRFGHSGLNTGYTCQSLAWTDSGRAIVVMAGAQDAHDELRALLAEADPTLH